MKKSILIFLLLVLAVLAATAVQAFDGDRKGFMLNLGAGFGQGQYKIPDGTNSVSFDGTGFSTDFKIGAGINPQTVIYYTNRALWYAADVTNSFTGETSSVEAINGLTAAGVSYFFAPAAPTFFVSSAIGVGVLTDAEVSGSESGIGFSIGAGYEFTTNWILEAAYWNATVAKADEISLNISSLVVTVSWFAY